MDLIESFHDMDHPSGFYGAFLDIMNPEQVEEAIISLPQ